MQTRKYNRKFFADLARDSSSSAEAIVPLVLDLMQPKSVVDIGCGTGAWLAAFHNRGIDDILGIDGDYLPPDALAIPRDSFARHDLQRPIDIGRAFDLAVCLEVAEHLPKDSAMRLLDTLCATAPVVLFSAAIPFQPGINHISCKWQSYWAERFSERNFTAIDCIRDQVWHNPDVAYWFAQNTIVYASQTALERWPKLNEAARKCSSILDIVHPRYYETLANPAKASPLRTLRFALRAATHRSPD